MLATIAKNSFFVLLARIVDIISAFVLMYLIARYLDLATFGQYGFIINFVTLLFPLGYVGISQITIREVAQNRKQTHQFLRASLLLRVGLSIILIGIIIFISLFTRQDTTGLFLAILLMAISESLSIYSLSFLDILNAYELMHYDTLSTMVYRLTTLVITVMIILLKGSLWYLFLALVLATLVKMVFLFYVYLKKIAPLQPTTSEIAIEPLYSNIQQTLIYLGKQAAPIAVAFLITQAYMKTGVLFLRALSSPEQIAIFYAPLRLLFQFQFIPFALSMALFPVFSRIAKPQQENVPIQNQQEELSTLFIRAFKFSVILCIPVIVIFLLLAKPVILLIFGNKFSDAAPCLQILMISFPVTFLELLMNNFLISIKRQKLILICNTLCLITNLGLNMLLIPYYGALGASWATSIAYLVLFVAFFYFIRQYTGAKSLLTTFPKPLLAGVGMALILYFTYPINWIIFGFLSSIIYLLLIYILKGVTPREIQTIKSILRPKPKDAGLTI
jgi:O-antigen/teichoic acid export membrane protein